MEPSFDRYFTLEEAAGMVGEVQQAFEQAHIELGEIRDQIILYKRIQLSREQRGEIPSEQESEVLALKWDAFEQAFNKWIQYFIDRGIIIRDLDRGLIDFPYRTQDGEEFLLCWQLGEDGLFYFHDLQEGFAGRKPISLLPD